MKPKSGGAGNVPGRAARRRAGLAAMAVAAIVATLAGCSAYSPQALPVGATRADITASMGAPSGRYPHADASERLEYARGPFGRHTYMLEVDAQGRLVQWQQVLEEANFNAISVGTSRAALLERIGHPAEVRPPGWPRKTWTVWSYRFETPFCQWFQVTLDGDTDSVVETNYGPDPMCSRDGNRADGP